MISNKTVFRPKMNRRIRFCTQNFKKLKLASEKTCLKKVNCFKMKRVVNDSQPSKVGVARSVGPKTPCKPVGKYC